MAEKYTQQSTDVTELLAAALKNMSNSIGQKPLSVIDAGFRLSPDQPDLKDPLDPKKTYSSKPYIAKTGPVTVAFPPCSTEILALINTEGSDDIIDFFKDYFVFEKQSVLSRNLGGFLDNDLEKCTQVPKEGPVYRWLGDCCICSPCLALDGSRNKSPEPPKGGETDTNNPVVDPHLKRLFVGDLIWLSYVERMGIFQILGVILDAYANNGRLPISNGSLDTEPPLIKDDVIALVLEVMTRQTKMGMSSDVRGRAAGYRTVLGWTSTAARNLNLDTNVNSGFSQLFHKFIYHALEFYKDKRLAVAIQGAAGTGTPLSMATLTTISDTLLLLKKKFEAFHYGRNYYNTLTGIIWAIAGMSVIRDLRTTLGIPPAFGEPSEFIPAAYDLLVLKQPVTSGETNRYVVHKECANNGRDILLDIEVVNEGDKSKDGDLEKWLTQIEPKIEAYRTAYRTLTGVDIGTSANPVVEQQA